MSKWLEYETDTGRIVCEVMNPTTVGAGRALLAVEDELNLDWNLWAVVDGELTRTTMTDAERAEAARLKRARADEAAGRIPSLMGEFVVALIEEDGTAQAALRAEYKRLKALLF